MDYTLHTSLRLNGLKMAIKTRQPKPGVLHHSDRCVHYVSKDYCAVLGGTPHLLDQGSVKLNYSLSVQRRYLSEDFYLGQ